jgi:hypothetical protein
VDDYWKILKQAQVLRVFSNFRWRAMRSQRAKKVRQLVEVDLQDNPRYDVTEKEMNDFRLWASLNSCAKLLVTAKDAQTRMVRTYNEDTGIPLLVIICPLYPRDEISKKGSLLVLTNALEDPMETEEEQRAALNKLSTVKKYKINPMALKDIDAEGRALLGDGLRDACLKQRADRQKFVAQIHEAVDHFKSAAAIRRENLGIISSNDNGNDADDTASVCAWEVEYSDIIPDD